MPPFLLFLAYAIGGVLFGGKGSLDQLIHKQNNLSKS